MPIFDAGLLCEQARATTTRKYASILSTGCKKKESYIFRKIFSGAKTAFIKLCIEAFTYGDSFFKFYYFMLFI